MTADRDQCIWMYTSFLDTAITRGKSINILMPMVNKEMLTESLLVIVEDENKRYCLMIDELSGQQQVVIKNLGSSLSMVDGVSGGAIMGDGKVSLILDVPGLIRISQ